MTAHQLDIQHHFFVGGPQDGFVVWHDEEGLLHAATEDGEDDPKSASLKPTHIMFYKVDVEDRLDLAMTVTYGQDQMARYLRHIGNVWHHQPSAVALSS